MREKLPARNTFREPRNRYERGAINLIFAVFVAVALAFLFSTVVPLMTPRTSIDQTEVFSALTSMDRDVVELQNGKLVLTVDGPDKLRAVVRNIEKQLFGEVLGRICAGVYEISGDSLATTPTSFRDANGRLCTEPSIKLQQRVISQAAALGSNVKANPFFLAIYDERNPELFTVHSATPNEQNPTLLVTLAPVGPATPGAGVTPTATSIATIASTPTAPVPTNTPVATPTAGPTAVKTINIDQMGGGTQAPSTSEGGRELFQF